MHRFRGLPICAASFDVVMGLVFAWKKYNLYRMAVENIWKHAPERELIRVLHGKKIARTLLLIEEVRYQCDQILRSSTKCLLIELPFHHLVGVSLYIFLADKGSPRSS